MQLLAKSSMKSQHTKCNSKLPKKDPLIKNKHTQKYKYSHQIGYFRLISTKQTLRRVCVHGDNDTFVNAHKTNAPTNIPKNTFV